MNAITARRRRILSLSTRVTVQCSGSVRGTESNFNVELNTLDGVCPRQDFLLFFCPTTGIVRMTFVGSDTSFLSVAARSLFRIHPSCTAPPLYSSTQAISFR